MTGDARELVNGSVVLRTETARSNPSGLSSFVSFVGWPGGTFDGPDGRDVSVHRADTGELLAFATLLLPGSPAVTRATGLAPRDVETTGFVARLVVRDGPDREAWLANVLYAVVREARLQRLSTWAAWTSGPADTEALGLRPVLGVASVDGLGLAARDIPYAMTQLADRAAAAGAPVLPNVLVDEIARTLEAYFLRIWDTAWFKAVNENRLSREAYVHSLGNLHSFVRFTTRLIGRCVASAKDSFLRAHFARHLREEINHELIIEQDLLHLHEDVDYVVNRMSPAPATRRFMATQESAIGFHQDPILTLAAALAAEGIAGRLDQRFMDALHRNLARWGVDEPEKATRFFSSHIEFDGGDDGHFAGTVKVLEKYVQDESRLQQFLSFLGAATEALEGSYETWQSDLRLFSARTPPAGAR